jgi:hypothetical protein
MVALTAPFRGPQYLLQPPRTSVAQPRLRHIFSLMPLLISHQFMG